MSERIYNGFIFLIVFVIMLINLVMMLIGCFFLVWVIRDLLMVLGDFFYFYCMKLKVVNGKE